MSLSVALDVETTGFGFKTRDRVIEVAGLVFDSETGQVLSKFETLINPLRNIPENSSEVHKLTAAHLSMAPTFEEFGPWLAHLLGGKRVVGHSVLFDVNFLNQEFQRNNIDFTITEFDCTRSLFNGSGLKETAEFFDINYDSNLHHGALYDAQLCLEVFLAGKARHKIETPAKFNAIYELSESRPISSLVTRQQLGVSSGLVEKQGFNSFNTPLNIDNPVEACYLWRLADYLSDLQITKTEREELNLLAADLGISSEDQTALHTRYVRELEKAAMRDGMITEAEQNLLEAFALALDVKLEVDLSSAKAELPAKGSLVCVTGTTSIDGVHWGKEKISTFLSANGYKFTDVLNKSDNVSLLLQESEGSQSSKVEKARKWGIPRSTIANFVKEIEG
ncbi:MAG: hypothetical protein RLZZ606_427 [Actinomycetota bacterium]|jgi:DNA polymerase-3 subunit epsilon